MKLQGKMRLVIGLIVVMSMIIVGLLSSSFNYTGTMGVVNDSMATSTTLAGNEISSKLQDYMNITSVTGHDAILTSNSGDKIKSDRIDWLATQYGFTSGNILNDKGVSLKDGTDFSERDYVIKALDGVTNVSDITLSKYTNTYGFSVAAPLVSDSGRITGVVYYRMDIDFMKAITDSIHISNNSYAYIVDGSGTIIVHPNEDLITEYCLVDQPGTVSTLGHNLVAGNTGDGEYEYNGQSITCGYAPIKGTNGWSIVIAAPTSDFSSTISRNIMKLFVYIIILAVVAIIVAGLYARTISGKIVKVKEALEKLAVGDFSNKLEQSHSKDELGVLINSTYSLQATLTGLISEIGRILETISNYDLTSENMKEYPGKFNELAESMNRISDILKGLILEVKESANCVGIGARELADAAENLSQGTVAQATSIQAVAEDIQDMAEKIGNTSASEATVSGELRQLDDQIQTGNNEMTSLLHAVSDVEAMSNDIRKIVGTIDSIAFQTNILALNAAVEAAGAGEYGKGFSVVADEIGNLAGKCSTSSKQTEELVNRCIEKINMAKASADSTFDCLSKVASNSTEIFAAFEQINDDTAKQAAHSDNIQREVNNISDIIQNNTAASQETAASSETLSNQADNLNALIAKFRL